MGYGTSAIIHNMWASVTGNAKQLREEADKLDVCMESCVQLMMRRATIDEAELRAMMDAETVLTPQKALECGLIDKIGVEQKEEPRTEQLLAENEQLIKQLNNRTFLDAEVKKFMRAVAPAQKQKSGFDAFFRKGEKE